MSSQSVRQYVERTIKQAIAENTQCWIARRDGQIIVATPFYWVDASAVAQAESTHFNLPGVQDGLVGSADFLATPKASGRLSMAEEPFWRHVDEWRHAQPVWKLYATGLYEQHSANEDSDGNPATLAAVLTAKRISDGLLRRVLIDRQYIHLLMSDVRDLEYCEMDMLAGGMVRIYSVTDESLLLGIVMPIGNGQTGDLYGTVGEVCSHCAGAGGTTLPVGITPATETPEPEPEPAEVNG